jgi:hypothetical protein
MMSKKQFVFLIVVLAILPSLSNAQLWKLRRYEASVSLCTSNIYCDIGGSADANNLYGLKDIQVLHTRPSLGIGARYKLNQSMSLKLNLITGFVSGNDKNSRNETRNFSFTSLIFEPSVQYEFYIFPEKKTISPAATFYRGGMINNFGKLYPYVFVGAGGIYSNPKLNRNDVPYIQNKFPKFGLSFPLGIGFKFSVTSKVSAGFEFGRRFTTTDYIEGYSSQFSKANDIYDFGMFSAIYKIPTDRRGRPIIGKANRYRR